MPGTEIIVAGDPGSDMYILQSGKCDVVSLNHRVMRALAGGDFFGVLQVRKGVTVVLVVKWVKEGMCFDMLLKPVVLLMLGFLGKCRGGRDSNFDRTVRVYVSQSHAALRGICMCNETSINLGVTMLKPVALVYMSAAGVRALSTHHDKDLHDPIVDRRVGAGTY